MAKAIPALVEQPGLDRGDIPSLASPTRALSCWTSVGDVTLAACTATGLPVAWDVATARAHESTFARDAPTIVR
jgi:hypothetical protein